MGCSELLVPDLQPSSLSHPGHGTLHDPADLPQSTAVRCPQSGQVVLDPSLPQALAIARGPVGSVSIQAARSTTPAATRLADQRDIIEQRQGHQRIVPLRAGDANRQGNALSVYEQMIETGSIIGPQSSTFLFPPESISAR
jgi:hypothetical protein